MLPSLFTVLISLAAVSPTLAKESHKHKSDKSPSVIFFIPDGFGPGLATLAREFRNVRDGPEEQWPKMVFDRDHVGSVRTRSFDDLTTDSAAAGTALATGVSTNNSFIGLDPERLPVASVLEGAKAIGYNTGLVATSRITHATPASFAAHVHDRNYENLIAEHQMGNYILGRQVDLLWGGGRRHFIPQNATGSSRTDDIDLLQQARDQGYSVLLDREDFDDYVGGMEKRSRNRFARDNVAHLPSIGLFRNSHLAFEIDRNATQEPSLAELSVGAISALHANDDPFFIMIEASRIDHAAHANDAAAMAWDSIAYDEAWEAVTEWVASQPNPDDYIVLSVADHDTGGVTLDTLLGWDPKLLLNASASAEYMTNWATPLIANQSVDFVKALINEELAPRLGFPALNETELEELADIMLNPTGPYAISDALAKPQSAHAGIIWGTSGHTQEDVNLYLYPTSNKDNLYDFIGSHKNIWVPTWIGEYIGVDLAPITARLQEQEDWFGELPESD